MDLGENLKSNSVKTLNIAPSVNGPSPVSSLRHSTPITSKGSRDKKEIIQGDQQIEVNIMSNCGEKPQKNDSEASSIENNKEFEMEDRNNNGRQQEGIKEAIKVVPSNSVTQEITEGEQKSHGPTIEVDNKTAACGLNKLTPNVNTTSKHGLEKTTDPNKLTPEQPTEGKLSKNAGKKRHKKQNKQDTSNSTETIFMKALRTQTDKNKTTEASSRNLKKKQAGKVNQEASSQMTTRSQAAQGSTRNRPQIDQATLEISKILENISKKEDPEYMDLHLSADSVEVLITQETKPPEVQHDKLKRDKVNANEDSTTRSHITTDSEDSEPKAASMEDETVQTTNTDEDLDTNQSEEEEEENELSKGSLQADQHQEMSGIDALKDYSSIHGDLKNNETQDSRIEEPPTLPSKPETPIRKMNPAKRLFHDIVLSKFNLDLSSVKNILSSKSKPTKLSPPPVDRYRYRQLLMSNRERFELESEVSSDKEEDTATDYSRSGDRRNKMEDTPHEERHQGRRKKEEKDNSELEGIIRETMADMKGEMAAAHQALLKKMDNREEIFQQQLGKDIGEVLGELKSAIKEELQEEAVEWKNEIQTRLTLAEGKVAEDSTTLSGLVTGPIQDTTKAVQFLSEKYDKIIDWIKNQNKKNVGRVTEENRLTTEIRKAKQLYDNISDKAINLDRHNRNFNLKIHNMESARYRENTRLEVAKLLTEHRLIPRCTNIDSAFSEIEYAYRMAEGDDGKPGQIVVTFYSRATRNLVLKNSRRYNQARDLKPIHLTEDLNKDDKDKKKELQTLIQQVWELGSMARYNDGKLQIRGKQLTEIEIRKCQQQREFLEHIVTKAEEEHHKQENRFERRGDHRHTEDHSPKRDRRNEDLELRDDRRNRYRHKSTEGDRYRRDRREEIRHIPQHRGRDTRKESSRRNQDTEQRRRTDSREPPTYRRNNPRGGKRWEYDNTINARQARDREHPPEEREDRDREQTDRTRTAETTNQQEGSQPTRQNENQNARERITQNMTGINNILKKIAWGKERVDSLNEQDWPLLPPRDKSPREEGELDSSTHHGPSSQHQQQRDGQHTSNRNTWQGYNNKIPNRGRENTRGRHWDTASWYKQNNNRSSPHKENWDYRGEQHKGNLHQPRRQRAQDSDRMNDYFDRERERRGGHISGIEETRGKTREQNPHPKSIPLKTGSQPKQPNQEVNKTDINTWNQQNHDFNDSADADNWWLGQPITSVKPANHVQSNGTDIEANSSRDTEYW